MGQTRHKICEGAEEKREDGYALSKRESRGLPKAHGRQERRQRWAARRAGAATRALAEACFGAASRYP